MSCEPWRAAVITFASLGAVLNGTYAVSAWNTGRSRLDLAALLVFAVVAVYRAALPTQYFERRVWVDSGASNLLLIRGLALLAELALARLIYSLVYRAKRPVTAWIVVLAVGLAQAFVTAGTVTGRRWLFAVEETLWLLAVLGLLISLSRNAWPMPGPLLLVAAGVMYVGFQSKRLAALWGAYDAHNDVPWDTTSNVSRDCSDYGIVHLIWATGYFGVLPLLLLLVYMTYAPRRGQL